MASACHTCRYRAILQTFRASRVRGAQLSFRRHASSIASATAINAPSDVQPALKPLYSALKALESDAANYANSSRVQLALRGLEGNNAVVRVAVLGLRDPRDAKRLARLLLVDPLEQKAEWEHRVENSNDSSGLLLR